MLLKSMFFFLKRLHTNVHTAGKNDACRRESQKKQTDIGNQMALGMKSVRNLLNVPHRACGILNEDQTD